MSSENEPDNIYATTPLRWDASDIGVSHISPKGTDRAIWRFQRQMASLIFNDAALEGNTYTEPEVRTLLDGVSVEGHSEEEEAQILNLSLGADLVLNLVRNGKFALSKDVSCRLHAIIAKDEAIDAGQFRGENPSSGGGGTVNVMGESTFHGPDAGPGLVQIFNDGLDRIDSIQHPVLKGATYAAFAAYNQFYFDGNKRTSTRSGPGRQPRSSSTSPRRRMPRAIPSAGPSTTSARPSRTSRCRLITTGCTCTRWAASSSTGCARRSRSTPRSCPSR